MAQVQAQVPGGSIQQKTAQTVGELKTQMSLSAYQASVNGEPAEDSYVLSDYEFVSFSQKVKGAVIIRRNGIRVK